ncbi:hypothetical protein VT98_11464, partial [Candidatus Electrothrix communis]
GYFASHPEAVQRIDALRRLASVAGFAERETAPLPTVLKGEHIGSPLRHSK